MLSGNGRHRRPRQAPALVVAAGVTGSAIAIPLLGATGAHAADGTAWDRVAECETGGAWSQNGGNGYYGGLQMSQEDWEAYGGLAYATSADQASRSQQIRVAEKVLAAQGIAVWPTCGPLAGLGGESSGSTTSDVESDSGSSSSSSDSSTSSDADDSGDSTETADSSDDSGSSASPSATESTESTDSAESPDSSDESSKSDTSSESASPADDASDAPTTKSDTAGIGDSADNLEPAPGTSSLTETGETGAGRHRGGSADDETASGRSESASGRHASRDDETARDAGDGTYTVRAGDNLWAIADSLDLAGGWSSLYAENKDTVGADPDHILPGQKLAVGVEPVEKQG
jgi:resuscitation-promoting factor RpfA